jgi:signal transduction histidine kinase
VSTWANVPGLVVLGTAFLLLFPDGRLPGRRWRWVLPVAATAGVLKVVAAAGGAVGMPAARALEGASVPAPWDGLDGLGSLLLLVATVGSVVALGVRYVGSLSERAAIRWLVLASVLSVAAVVAGPTAELVATPLVPAAIALAVFRHRLFDADRLARRALTYGGMTAALAAAYVAAVLPLSLLAPGRAPLIAAGVVAAVAATVRETLQRAVKRVLYGGRADPYAVLQRLLAEVSHPVSSDTLLQRTTSALAEVLRLPFVAVVDAEGGVSATAGEEPADVTRFPLEHRGAEVGQLVVGARAAGERLSSRDVDLLRDAARHIAATVAALRLDADLARAQQRERDRIRRDLHDRLGPALSGVLLRLDAARASGSLEHVEAIRQDLAAALTDVRRLIDALEPAELGDLGLVAALSLHPLLGDQVGRVQLAADALPELPADVAAAAYLIVTEAVANAVRHAEADSCEVRLAVEDGTLVLVVADDGIGGARERPGGLGLSSMQRRAQELGGTLTVRSGAGTTVTARLPLGRS